MKRDLGLTLRETKSTRRRIRISAAAVFVGLGWVVGCGGGGGTPSTESQQGTLSRAAVYIAQTPGGPNPVISQTATSMTVMGVRKDLVPGSVIVSNAGTGALRKVQSVSTAGGNTTVQTTSARLTEAFDTLHVKAQPAFTQAQLGNIQSSVPGLSFKWVKGPARSAHTRDVEYNKLEITYDNLSLNVSKGLAISGTAAVTGSPDFECQIDRAPGDLLPSIKSLHAGFQAELTGSVTITSKYGGDISASKTWFDQDVGIPIEIGYLVFIPHLKIESSITGSASGSMSHTQTVDFLAAASEDYSRGSGWTPTKTITPQMTASESNVEAAFGVDFKPVEVTLSFNLYDIVGPYVKLNAGVSGTGTHKVVNSVEGIDAVAKEELGGEIGIRASTPEAFSEFFEAAWTPVDVTFDIASIELFHQFFPFTGTASIQVGDNGNLPDDIFSVAVDGISLGQTDKGGTGEFRVTALTPGSHTLTIVCLDDGANGADIGTLGINLSNGFTFDDGSTDLSDLLSLNESKDYVIVAPTRASRSRARAQIPKNPYHQEHLRRR